jgi:opacity protein-like surface antigen
MNRYLAVMGLAVLVAGAPAAAQEPVTFGPARFEGGLHGIVAQPVGEFDRYVDVGFGLGGTFRINLDPRGAASVRFDLAFVNYGNETKEVCLGGGVGCRIRLDLTTSNNIGSGHAGLQFMVPSGPVRPYVHGGVGGSYFGTESRVRGTNNSDDFASTTNFDDGTFSWIGGGGLLIPLSLGRTPISIDLGARYLGNGEVTYLTEGGITDNPDGTISLDPIRSEANLVKYYLGVSVGIRGNR